MIRSLFFSLLDGIATDVFGPGDQGVVVFSEVQCTGLESNLTLCPHIGLDQHMCAVQDSTGVICEKRSKDKIDCNFRSKDKL